jgi:hypothetical protein
MILLCEYPNKGEKGADSRYTASFGRVGVYQIGQNICVPLTLPPVVLSTKENPSPPQKAREFQGPFSGLNPW